MYVSRLDMDASLAGAARSSAPKQLAHTTEQHAPTATRCEVPSLIGELDAATTTPVTATPPSPAHQAAETTTTTEDKLAAAERPPTDYVKLGQRVREGPEVKKWEVDLAVLQRFVQRNDSAALYAAGCMHLVRD